MSSKSPLQDYNQFLATLTQISDLRPSDFQATFLATELGTRIHWFCPRNTWNINGSVVQAEAHDSSFQFLIFKLSERVKQFDYSLFNNMLLPPGERYMSRVAFTGDVQTGKGAAAWYHGIQHAVLLDRLLWVYAVYKPGVDERPTQKPHGNLHSGVQDVQKIRTAYLCWNSTVTTFLSQWNAASCTGSLGNGSQLNSTSEADTPPKDKVLASLFHGGQTAEDNRHLATVETNFCWAALGLRLLFLNALQPTHKTDDNDSLSACLWDLVRTRDVSKLTDFDILKPLYLAITFTPVVLLGKTLCSYTGSRRVSLGSLSQHCLQLPQLVNDSLRAGVEHDCWLTIVDMALHGHLCYQSRMSSCASSWTSLELTPTSSLYFPQQYDIEEWQRNWSRVAAPRTAMDELLKELSSFTVRSSFSLDNPRFPLDPIISWPLQLARHILAHKPIINPAAQNSGQPPTVPKTPVHTTTPQHKQHPIAGEPALRFPGAWSPAVHTASQPTPIDHVVESNTTQSLAEFHNADVSASIADGSDGSIVTDAPPRAPLALTTLEYTTSQLREGGGEEGNITSHLPLEENDDGLAEPVSVEAQTQPSTAKSLQVDFGGQIANQPHASVEPLRRSERNRNQPLRTPTTVATTAPLRTSSIPSKRKRRACSIKREAKHVRFAQLTPMPAGEAEADLTIKDNNEDDEEIVKEVYYLRYLQEQVQAIEPVRTLEMTLACPVVTILEDSSANHVLEWKNELFNAIEWKGLENDFKLLCELLAHVASTEHRDIKKVDSSSVGIMSIPRQTWDRLSTKEKQVLLRTANIHVVAHRVCPLREGRDVCMNVSDSGLHGCTTMDNRVHPILSGILDWDSESLSTWLDLDDLRPVHDLTLSVTSDNPNTRIHKSSLEEFLKERVERKHILNFLSIDLSGQQVSMPVGGLDDLSKFFSRDDPKFTFKTPWDRHPHAWALAAHRSAISTTHMDPAGFLTHIRIILGIKIWFVATNAKMPLPRGDSGFITSDFSWDVVVLRPDDDFFMHPGVPHFVLSLYDCLAVGGHFFSSVLFSKSLRAIVVEHYFGKDVTNTEHLTSGLAFFKAISGYLSLCKLPELHVRRRNSFPEWDQLASLIVLVMHFDQLDPLLPESGEDCINPYQPWQFSDGFAHDHCIAYSMAVQLGSEVYCDEFCSALDYVEAEFSALVSECEQVSSGNGDRRVQIVEVRETIELFRTE